MENRSLGSLIREERIKKGVTQAELGKMIGLKSARVSKIEHGAPITPEVASFILSKLGSRLLLSVVDDDKFNDDESQFVSSAVLYFSLEKGLPMDRAYSYLDRFKGVEFLRNYQDIEQTLSYEDICNDLTKVCANNGGAL